MRVLFGICLLFLTSIIANAQASPARKAAAYEQQEQWKQAEAAWREVIQRSPADGAAYAHLGLALSHEEDYSQAAAAYRKALALKADLPGIELNLGLALFKQEKLDDAIGPLKSAVAKSPDNLQAQLLLEVLLRNRSIRAGVALSEGRSRQDPGQPAIADRTGAKLPVGQAIRLYSRGIQRDFAAEP